MNIILTGLEIKHLAESAGFTVSGFDSDDLEAEHSIEKCPANGVRNDDGESEIYNYVTRCDGCEGNECTPLGDPLPI